MIKRSLAPVLSPQDRKVIFLSSLGGALEFYDFIIYVYVSSIIGEHYFPATSSFYSLMSALLVFALSYLMRPLGGLLFSHLGDTRGRKKTFLLTVMLMALPTLGIALLPTYAEIGVWATVLLVIFRLTQGLAVGGEIPGAIAFTTEHIHPKRRSFACGCIYLGITLGMVFAQGIILGLKSFLSPDDFANWGWRIAFYIGSVLALLALFSRRALTETPVFMELKKKMAQTRLPFKTLIQEHRTALFIGIGLTAIGSVDTYLLYVYLPRYLELFGLYSNILRVEWIQLGSLILQAALLPLVGLWGDRYGVKRLYRIAALGLVIVALPVFLLFEVATIWSLILAMALFATFTAMIAAFIPCLLVDLFPPNIRYTGIAMSYNLAYAFFGGVTPMVTIGLVQWTGITWMPALFLMIVAGGAFLVANKVKTA